MSIMSFSKKYALLSPVFNIQALGFALDTIQRHKKKMQESLYCYSNRYQLKMYHKKLYQIN